MPSDTFAGCDRAQPGTVSKSMNALFAEAVRDAATRIDGGPPESFREQRIERALLAALRERVEPGVTVGARRQFVIPAWDPQPGGVDLFVLDRSGSLSIAAELKIDDVEQTLWDLFKLVALVGTSPVASAYLVAVAPAARWRKAGVNCTELFPETDEPSRMWSSRELFERYEAAWRWLLAGGRARPTQVPAVVEVRFVASERVSAYPDYELRAVAVRGIVERGWLPFAGDWPVAAGVEVVWMPSGVLTEIQLTGEQTDNAFCLLVDHPPRGWSLPPHRHRNEAETILVLDGTFELTSAAKTTRLGPGQSIHIPRGVLHSGVNVGERIGRRVVIFSPAGMERFFLEAGAPTVAEVDERLALQAALRYGWEF
jgi:quercetin dioxygenase-like cupin family protein